MSYRLAEFSQPGTRLNTTDLATSFTTESDLEMGTEYIFSVRTYTRVGPGNTTTVSSSTLNRPRKTLRFTLIVSNLLSIAAVEGVEVVSLCDTVVLLLWNKLVIPYVIIDYYTVVYSHDQQDREMNAVFPLSATSGIVSDLNSTVVYRFQVFATITVDGRTVDGERSTLVHVGINSKQ